MGPKMDPYGLAQIERIKQTYVSKSNLIYNSHNDTYNNSIHTLDMIKI